MNDLNFVDRVKRYFDYLVSEFGFRISRADNSEVRPQTDGAVEYVSDSIGIIIDSETGYAGVRFYRVKDGRKYYVTPIDIYEYLNTSNEEKQLLLSTNPADKFPASTLFNKKLLLNQPGWKGSRGTVQDLDNELRNFSNWIKTHAKLCLEGDLSRWMKFFEYKVNRARADYLRRGEDELIYAQVKDADGNWKLIKQSVFKDELEHLEKIKKEFSS
jgi:hypothetical protein